jgi:glycerol-3-phosphate acyltransferase PlsX
LAKVVAIDAMGGDHGVSVTVASSLAVVNECNDIGLILVGQQSQIQDELSKHGAENNPAISVVHTDQSIEMNENPLRALRTKKKSSMRVAVNLVHEGQAHACVSAGNTGALLATANFVLGTVSKVSRPGLITAIPTANSNHPVYIIDLGANVDSEPKYLVDFATMGSVMIEACRGIKNPKVALLSNGHESVKGNALVKQTAALLEKTKLNYVGYVEADDIFSGDVDLIVCDGFTGNIALKSLEGTARFIKKQMKACLHSNLLAKILGLLMTPFLRPFINNINPHRYNGASFLGIKGIVIKSHGSADAESFAHAIREAIREVEHAVPEKITAYMQKNEDVE